MWEMHRTSRSPPVGTSLGTSMSLFRCTGITQPLACWIFNIHSHYRYIISSSLANADQYSIVGSFCKVAEDVTEVTTSGGQPILKPPKSRHSERFWGSGSHVPENKDKEKTWSMSQRSRCGKENICMSPEERMVTGRSQR